MNMFYVIMLYFESANHVHLRYNTKLLW